MTTWIATARIAFGVFDVEHRETHAGIDSGSLPQHVLPPAGDDDLIALRVKGFGKSASYTGTAACDENCVIAKSSWWPPMSLSRSFARCSCKEEPVSDWAIIRYRATVLEEEFWMEAR